MAINKNRFADLHLKNTNVSDAIRNIYNAFSFSDNDVAAVQLRDSLHLLLTAQELIQIELNKEINWDNE